jgi:uncharacterized delta-60 repeat protein
VPNSSLAAVLAALAAASFALPALAQPGQLDPTFGNQGIDVLPLSVSVVYKTLQQPDAKLLVAASVGAPSTDIIRLLPTGAVDTTFGTQGVVTLSIPNNEFSLQGDMQLQPDGAIILVGVVNVPVRRGPKYHGVVARFLADGTPDASFGTNGIVQLTPLGGSLTDAPRVLLLQTNGQILIADDFSADQTSRSQVTRLNSDGSMDTSFGTGGIASIPGGTGGAPNALALQSDGKILAIASAATNAFATRLLPNGTVDPDMTPGTVIASSAAQAQLGVDPPLAVQSNDSYITEQAVGSQLQQFDLERFTLANTRDTKFKSPVIKFGPGLMNLSQDYANLVQPNGSILAVGRFLKAPNESFAIARVLTSGKLDTGFGQKGEVQTMLPGNDPLATSVALQSDGNIVVAGTSGSQLALVRYLGN